MEEERETLLMITNQKSKSNYWIINTLESTTYSWIFIGQSNPWKAALSWLIFFIFTIGVPILSHIVYQCNECDNSHQRPFDLIVQLSLSACSAISFVNLSSFARKYGLRRFLFLDKLPDVSVKVRDGYSDQLQRSMKLLCAFIIPSSQFASLLVTTKTGSLVNISTAGELALCSVTLVSGLCICLRSAAKVTHKAQSVTSLGTKWHTCATIDSFDDVGPTEETPVANISDPVNYHFNAHMDLDMDEEEEDELDNTKMGPIYRDTISYQKRQALATYFENSRSGITVFGVMLDRTSLRMIFAVEMSLTLWLLKKTINFS
ncbi:hypothetical protein L1987_60664 [Smallanthus sonchifolius]|uniref:Uncharacterized protein n=1 Tax=Smallanthus sonchifolius TaxID=185202 RepID=A0ACB9D8U6_9ASTR|nr:hypothetical protein L1987_60664 [Smallanthus sonchifolius]